MRRFLIYFQCEGNKGKKCTAKHFFSCCRQKARGRQFGERKKFRAMARPSRLVEGFSFKGTARRCVDGLHSDVARARRRWTKEGRFQSCVPLRSAAARSSRCVLLSLQAPQRPQSVESKKTSRGRKGLSKSNNSVRKEVLHILLRIEGDGSFASLATGRSNVKVLWFIY